MDSQVGNHLFNKIRAPCHAFAGPVESRSRGRLIGRWVDETTASKTSIRSSWLVHESMIQPENARSVDAVTAAVAILSITTAQLEIIYNPVRMDWNSRHE